MSSRDPEDRVPGTYNLRWLLLSFSSSLVLHGVAFASLGNGRSWSLSANPASEMSFVVTPPPPEPPKPPEPEREEPPAPLANAPKPANTAPREPSPPPPAAPLDLRGLTLTNGEGSFAMPTGNGLELDRPIGTGRTPNPEPVRAPAPVAVPAPPALVALDALGTRPKPPALEASLRQNYPGDARRRAIGGSASVLARIDRDGVARGVSVVSETFAGFGDACRRTLAGSRWSPPLDNAGRAVSTQVRYTCHFKVAP
jgi:periplasmic protein TonB